MKRLKAIGLEDALLVVGTITLAVGGSFISPAGPWIVVGLVCLALGLAVAVQTARRGRR